ncbi:MAG: alpha-amylase family glycosyl hydrolase [Treponema sp.]|nr:alpha-amylase family glycosyl hydrolase [Treponema sp.]
MKISYNEFHINKDIRDKCGFSLAMFASTGNAIFTDMKAVRIFAEKFNTYLDKIGLSEKRVSAGSLNAMGLIDEILHYVCMLYRRNKVAGCFQDALALLDKTYGKEKVDELLLEFTNEFPPVAVYRGEITAEKYLAAIAHDVGTGRTRSNREATLEEMVMLHLENENPAFMPFSHLFSDSRLARNPLYMQSWSDIQKYFADLPKFGPFDHDLINFMREPVVFAPTSLRGQLEYIQKNWLALIGEWLKRLLAGLDTLSEEEKAMWHPVNGGEVDAPVLSFENLMNEYERFSPDQEWMPKVVLMAKTVLVWLDQLTKKYGYPIERLDQIPDAELDALRDEGFTGLWLIGLWQRSNASKRIKQICGNPEAAASAYSLMNYNIADNLGGWDALDNLRRRLWMRGIRLASDMVPNHTGMDAAWVVERPDLFVQRRDNPFPQYTYNGENLSHDSRVGVYLEDHYYSKNDCAVVFKRVDNQTGDVRYIYHGNDGTGMPWNDTAQIDFLNPAAREAVIQEILHVARNFPIIRFDAAMVLAKKHIRRLWYPEPGHGGDIATRSETGLSTQQFNDAIPNEFWREVVDRVAREVPDTLLLAEAFWMMEGYFVRTLGMHRVYNSAFMNMLKKEENQKYRDTVKNTIKFDPQILKRYVNFMNNPDEETAVAQFGKGDKYFGVCTLMITMPGLPMFGHGQLEGFEEKYGMEYTKAYRNEVRDEGLYARHQHDIFPLMKKRYLFSQSEDFLFYDVWDNGHVNENVFAYSNRAGNERAVVFYNNKYEQASGWIKQSCEYAVKNGDDLVMKSRSISEGLGINDDPDNYLIFREHRTDLWYVRSCRDICQNGLFIALDGFEYQVMMDIQMVADTEDKKWSTLYSLLNGRGCYDLEVEWQEVCYRDLYKALGEFITPAVLDETSKLLEKSTDALVTKYVKTLEKKGTEFYKVANTFVPAKKDAKTKKAVKPLEPKKQFAAFAKNYKSTVSLCKKALAVKDKKNMAEDYVVDLAKFAKAGKVNDFISLGIKKGAVNAMALVLSSVVFALDDKTMAAKWSLARKFTEYMRIAKIKDADKQRWPLDRMYAMTSLVDLNLTKKESALAASELLMHSRYSYLLTGTNSFNNVVWFNKESCDSALYLLVCDLVLAGIKPDKAFAFYKLLCDAQKKSEYQAAAFIDCFVEKKKAKKVAGKKVSAKKETASKTKKVADKKAPAKKETASKTKKVADKKAPVKKETVSKAKKVAEKKPASKKEKEVKVKKATEKKSPAKKEASSKAKKTVEKKTPVKKETASKAKKVAEKKPASKKEKEVKVKKVAEKKTSVKKEAPSKKETVSKAKKTVEKKTPVKKENVSKTKKAADKKASEKKTPVKKETVSKTKKAADKKVSEKKSPAKKETASKAKKVTVKKTSKK